MVTRRAGTTAPGTGLAMYTRCAQHSTARVIADYSTSFGMAARLLGPEVRTHVRNVYGLVRIADEIVDGAAAQAGLPPGRRRGILQDLEDDTDEAVACGYSTNLVVHAFAGTARTTGIDRTLTGPFFQSMRRDTDDTPLRVDEVDAYIHGSAEVVGLMCLKAFLHGHETDPATRRRLEDGARHLGAAFQKINFLRDLGADLDQLGRNYFPHIRPGALTDADKDDILRDIRADLDAAYDVIGDLPASSRTAVATAAAFFDALCAAVQKTPATDLPRTRVSVPTVRKLFIFARARLPLPRRARG